MALRRPIEPTPYASEDYQSVLQARGITCSTSRRGNCYDNEVMESFISPTVKTELSDRFDSSGEARMERFDFTEVFNQRRRHSTIGQISRAAFEKAWATRAAYANCLGNRGKPSHRWLSPKLLGTLQTVAP